MSVWALEVWEELKKEIEQSISADLSQCGTENMKLLLSAAENIFDEGSRDTACRNLDRLLEVSHAEMPLACDSWCWRRLYTDASLLRSLADVSHPGPSPEDTFTECIARLDRGIIIAGAPGPGRLDAIIDVIQRVQSQYLASAPRPAIGRHTSMSIRGTPLPLATSGQEIPSLPKPPSLQQFRTLRSYPFILRGYVSDWPALTSHPWASLEYLRTVAGPGRVVPVEVGSDYRAESWTQKLMPWDELLSSLEFESSSDVLYMAQHNLFMQFPKLRDDICLPDYVYTCPAPTTEYPDYTPPANEEQLVLNSWLGPKGTVSPAHTDPYFNAYAQVAGRKTIWLTPSAISTSMYPYAPSSASANNPAANTVAPSMSNTSRVDVFVTPDQEEISRREFPAFWKDVVPQAMSATLNPGDLLIFPPGWWHAMRSEDTSFSVSMWF